MTKDTQKKTKANGRTSFAKIMFASGVGFILASVVLTFLSVIFIIIVAGSASKNIDIKEKSVLTIKLNRQVVEQHQDNFNFDFDLWGMGNTSPVGLNKTLEVIEKAKDDENIKGIFLDLSVVQASLAELAEIRDAIIDFKKSGKFVIAHSNRYFSSSYYLATAADKIYITPTGNFLWKGFASQVMFFKGLLEKLDVEPVIIRHGKYKSAVEPFLLDSMSKESRLQTEKFLNSFWNYYLKEIADARNLDIDALNLYADSLMINSSEKAVTLGFVDGEKFRNDVIDEMKNLADLETDHKFRSVSINDYIDAMKDMPDISTPSSNDKLAIIYAEGQIINGKSDKNSMGAITISQAIRKAASDSSVKAIVFRVNSPGGSALASEIILHEIELAKKNKPVVVSMGRYAASGGYYISCYADKIYAEPYTITGSIGVFGLLFNIEDLLNNKLGISIDVVKTNKNADFGNITRPLSAQERQFLQHQIETVYDDFISHVAFGRNLTKEYVDSIGQGRVWAANDAKEIGLVDEIAGIDSAVYYAANLADLTDYRIVEYPEVLNFFEKFMRDYQTRYVKKNLGQLYSVYTQIQQLQNMQGVQMRMVWDINIQ